MKTKSISLIILAIIFIFLIIFFWHQLTELFSSQIKIKKFILDFGILAPIIFVLLTAIQVLIIPIPGQAIGIASGFIFGPIMGTILSMLGLIIGSYLAFILARKLGRPFVEKILNRETLKKFDKISSENGIFALFLIYLFPALPDDAICYVAGLTKIKIKTLVLISAIGRLPGFLVLNLVGAGMASANPANSLILFSILLFVSLILFLFKNKLEKFTLNLIKKITRKKPKKTNLKIPNIY